MHLHAQQSVQSQRSTLQPVHAAGTPHACAGAQAGQHTLFTLVAAWCLEYGVCFSSSVSAKKLTQHHIAGWHIISHVVAVAGGQHRVCKGDGAGQLAVRQLSCTAGLALQGALQAAVPIPVLLLMGVLLLLPPAFSCSKPPTLACMLSSKGHGMSRAPRGHAGDVLQVAPGGAHIEDVAGLHPQRCCSARLPCLTRCGAVGKARPQGQRVLGLSTARR